MWNYKTIRIVQNFKIQSNPFITLAARSKTFSGFGGSLAGFGASESPKIMLTKQYSISAMNTNLFIREKRSVILCDILLSFLSKLICFSYNLHSASGHKGVNGLQIRDWR